MQQLAELIGVYHANGGLKGEAAYVFGKLLGTAHCALCDITHSPIRRKPEWDRLVTNLGVPFRLLHLNELDDDLEQACRRYGSPVVLARDTDGRLSALLGPADLELGGSITDFSAALRTALHRLGYAA